MSYNGWKNYETWNVALWIGNDEPLYRDAVNYARSAGKGGTYLGFVREALANRAYDPVPWTTPDDVLWLDPTLDYERLDEMVREMGEE